MLRSPLRSPTRSPIVSTEGAWASPYGPNLITNGTFDTDTDWTKGTGWSIGSGVASVSGAQTANTSLQQVNVLTLGKTYKITWTISNFSAGLIRPLIGSSGGIGSWVSGDGEQTQTITHASGQPHVYLQASSTFIGDIDNVTVQEVL